MSAKKPAKKDSGKSKGPEKRIGSIIPPSLSEIEAFVRTQQYITPYVLSERYGLRLSIAKDLLTTLARKGIINLVTGTNRVRIYAPVAPQVPASAKRAGQPVKKATEEEPVHVEEIVSKEKKAQKGKGKKKK